MRLLVQHSLIYMGNAPPLWNIEVQHPCQLIRSLAGNIVPPGSKWYQQLVLFVKGQIAMHHGTYAHGADFLQLQAVFFLYLSCQLSIAGLDALPGLRQIVGPYAVLQLVFPAIAPHRYGLNIRCHENTLDAGGSQLNAQGCFPGSNFLLDIFQTQERPLLTLQLEIYFFFWP